MRGQLAAGWQVVTIDGQLLTDQGVLRWRAAIASWRCVRSATRSAPNCRRPRKQQRRWLPKPRLRRRPAPKPRHLPWRPATSWTRRRRALSVAEEVARTTQRRLDGTLRDQALRRTRLAGLESEADDIALRIAAAWDQRSRQPADAEPRLDLLTSRRSELTARLGSQQAHERNASEAARRAEVTLAMTDERSQQLDTEEETLAGRLAQLRAEADSAQADHDAAAGLGA